MTIYTKTGDDGTTSLYKQGRLSKKDKIFEVLGGLDELNAILGLCQSTRIKNISKVVVDLQRDLFSLGAELAGADLTVNWATKASDLEAQIDTLDNQNEPLKNFILPGGSIYSSYLHLARAVCRRVERAMVGAAIKKEKLMYINRFSDLLFVMARYLNMRLGIKEEVWKS